MAEEENVPVHGGEQGGGGVKRILLVVPTFPQEPHVCSRTRESIEALQTPEGYQIDTMWASHDDPGLSHYQNLRDKHNAARGRVLAEGYDYLLSIEADMIVPADAVQKLLDVNLPVAYGLYVGRLNKIWLCLTDITATKGVSLVEDMDKAREAWGKIIPSAGVGMGCTLIAREVLEAVEFRLGRGKESFADDWYFAVDCRKAKIKSGHNLGLVCGHIRRGGDILWPTVDDPKRWWRVEAVDGSSILEERYECLILRALWIPSESRYAKKGERIVLTKMNANQLIALKAVKVLGEASPAEDQHTGD